MKITGYIFGLNVIILLNVRQLMDALIVSLILNVNIVIKDIIYWEDYAINVLKDAQFVQIIILVNIVLADLNFHQTNNAI